MDSSTFIATITVLTTLIGAISPIIVALIQSRKERSEKLDGIYLPGNAVLHRPNSKMWWLVIILFALLGGILGYSGATLASSNSLIDAPTETPSFSQDTFPPKDWQLIYDYEFGNMDVRWYHLNNSLLFNETYLNGLHVDKTFYSEAKFQSIRESNNNGYGFIYRFGFEENFSYPSYYYFVIRDDQNFGIYLNREGQTSSLFISESNKIIRGGVNKLGIFGDGGKYKFLINDAIVAELEDLQVKGDLIGFISPKSVIAHEYVRIDEFKLYTPP